MSPSKCLEMEYPSIQRKSHFTSTFIILGALFSAIAFLCAVPYCRDQVNQWMPVVAYIGICTIATFLLTRRPRQIGSYCVILALLALAIRLAWAHQTAFPPTGDDYEHYRSVSLDLLQGKWDELYCTFWPWGYFLYLYALARLFGSSLLVPITANAIVGSATTLLVYAIARRIYKDRPARIAAALYALWPGVIYWTGVLCTEIPHIFLFLAALMCLLMGIEAKAGKGAWLVAGAVLAALAEFVRALSPLLLLPFACYVCACKNETDRSSGTVSVRRRWRYAVIALGAYIICLGVLLTAESIAAGYPNFSTSHTMGVNLAFGLNWESRGMFNSEDAKIMESNDPREVNRRGIELALRRLKAMSGSNWWQFPVLAAVKFRENWSHEAAGFDATYSALPDEQRERHWLSLYIRDLSAIAQSFHTLVLALVTVGFWRNRRSGNLAFLGAILLAFALLHVFLEVDCRYHFGIQSLLAIAGAGAFSNHAENREGDQAARGRLDDRTGYS